jgi:SET domain-containing protein
MTSKSTRRFRPSAKIEARPSKGKGRGVFALRAIGRGEVIETAPALLVPRSQGDDLITSFLSHYMFQTDAGGRYVIGLGFTSLFNHGDKPNAEFYASMDRIVIKARRPIAAGAEITVDYGWSESEWEAIGVSPK